MSSASKTKEWLKTQLINHGVPLPSSSAKKEEYQRLYEEQVRPRQNNTEFSSDDDTEEPSAHETPTHSPSVSNSRPQNGTDGSTDKHVQWVQRLTDANLYTALKANGRQVGGIVESTRALYQKLLTEMLKNEEQKTLNEIENYLSQNKEARDLWTQNGVELLVNGGYNGVTNGNGNSENGYSDTDDDETVETASRASRSSRASSKRMTPIRTSAPAASTPAKETTPQRSVVDSNIRSRRGGSRDDVLGGINEVDEDHGTVTASSSRSTVLSEPLFSRVSSPDSNRFIKPVTVRKTVVETVERRSHHYYDDSSENVNTEPKQRSSPKAASRAVIIMKYVLLLVAVVVVPVLAYYIYGILDSSNFVGSESPKDELDVILQSLDEQGPDVGQAPGPAAAAGEAGGV